MIPTVGKSTLLGFQYRLVGFAHRPHPLERKKKIQLTFFYQQSTERKYLICMSDVTRQQAKQFKPILSRRLGSIVGADEVVPYVQRAIDGAAFDQFKEIMKEGFGSQIEWWNGHIA